MKESPRGIALLIKAQEFRGGRGDMVNDHVRQLNSCFGFVITILNCNAPFCPFPPPKNESSEKICRINLIVDSNFKKLYDNKNVTVNITGNVYGRAVSNDR